MVHRSPFRRPAPGAVLAASLFALLFASLAPRSAGAAVITLEAVTDVPLDVGVRLQFEIPVIRLRLGASVGWLPQPYIGLYNGAMQKLGAYDQSTADLLTASLSNSLVARGRVGWRPVGRLGFYFDLGYTYVALGGAASPSATVSAVASAMPPPSTPQSATYNAAGKLHMLDAEVGWILTPTPALSVRLALGCGFTFASTQDLTPGFSPSDPSAQASFTTAGQQKLDANSKLIIPTATLALGWNIL